MDANIHTGGNQGLPNAASTPVEHGTYSNTDINRYMDTQVHIGTSGSGASCKALTLWIPLNVTFTQFQSHCVNYIRL